MLHTLMIASVFLAMVCAPALVTMRVGEHLEDDEEEVSADE